MAVPLPADRSRNASTRVTALPARERLLTPCVGDHTRPLDEALRRRVVGQEEAVQAMTCAFARVLSGLRDPVRPALTAILLGPTGVGKTQTARALAHALFGSERALIQVNCEEYTQGHELAKLLGAPPGYVGHQLEPLLSQRRLDEPFHRALASGAGMVGESGGRLTDMRGPAPEKPVPVSVVMFDEIEKAHPTLWNAMLGVLEDGRVTLGDNTTTDLSHAIVIMTSNVGSREMSRLVEAQQLGFRPRSDSTPSASRIRQAALTAARTVFPVEFLNRFDETIVYAPLERHHLDAIFDRLLTEIHIRALEHAGVPLIIRLSAEARNLVIARGTDLQFGARPLRRAVESALIDPLSRLIAAHRLTLGDVIEVECQDGELVFYRSAAGQGAGSTIVSG